MPPTFRKSFINLEAIISVRCGVRCTESVPPPKKYEPYVFMTITTHTVHSKQSLHILLMCSLTMQYYWEPTSVRTWGCKYSFSNRETAAVALKINASFCTIPFTASKISTYPFLKGVRGWWEKILDKAVLWTITNTPDSSGL